MSRFFTQKLSIEELKTKIEDAELEANSKDAWHWDRMAHLTPHIEKDVSKVNFDLENEDPASDAPHDSEGYLTLPNGLTLRGMEAGGDWEWPIYYIVYWDGKALRGYVPKDGNPWNTDEKIAYGNEDIEVDIANAIKRGYLTKEAANLPKDKIYDVDQLNLRFDWDAIFADIQKRIVFKGN